MVEQVVLNNLTTSAILSISILTAYYFEDNATGILFGIIIGSAINYFFAQQILGIITGLI
jgi:predicted Co/Zn/Cd cation transporter (cation efflux family)